MEDRKKNLVYDEETGEWVRKWGYKGKNMQEGGEWLVEVDEKKKKTEEGLKEGESIRGEGRREKMERVRRQMRKERNNVKRAGKGGG